MEEKDQPFKAFDKRQFTHDPVAFGALMDFQYGESDVSQEEATRILFEEVKGIRCENFEELGLVMQDLDFWQNLGEQKEAEPLQFRLYVNNRPASKLGANLLSLTEVEFELVRTSASTLQVHDERTPLPILVNLESGISYKTLAGVKKFARLQLFDEETQKQYYPSSAASFYDTDVFFPTVMCFNSEGQPIFRGDIEESPIPLQEALSWNWYSQRTNGRGFDHVYGWNLGNWPTISRQSIEKGALILPNAPAALFFDEVEALRSGKGELIVDDHGCMYCVNYEAYFVKNDQLFRIYAHMTD